MLSQGEPVPEHFSRPEVLAILRDYYVGVAQAAAARDPAAEPTPAGALQQKGVA
jgi:ATP sulfurylase